MFPHIVSTGGSPKKHTLSRLIIVHRYLFLFSSIVYSTKRVVPVKQCKRQQHAKWLILFLNDRTYLHNAGYFETEGNPSQVFPNSAQLGFPNGTPEYHFDS